MKTTIEFYNLSPEEFKKDIVESLIKELETINKPLINQTTEFLT